MYLNQNNLFLRTGTLLKRLNPKLLNILLVPDP